jgi:trans-AT polyketide synthase, acyltransferase and oxidoreductase domains
VLKTAIPSPAMLAGKELRQALEKIREALRVVRNPASGAVGLLPGYGDGNDREIVGILPPLYPEWLGDRHFRETHNVRFPYIAGEMATGIATSELVAAAVRGGFMGFLGTAGLSPDRIEQLVTFTRRQLNGNQSGWGANLIHSPTEPQLEDAAVDIFLRNDVRRVSASAFMALAPSVVRYAAAGLQRDGDGSVRRRGHVLAKISRPEVAAQFAAPPPGGMLDSLRSRGAITSEEAELAARLPLAEDITVEADSGGHTDNRPLVSLLPVIARQCENLSSRNSYGRPVRVGAAGGLGTPSAVAAAFSLGAAYVMTGSINQSCVEAGTSPAVKRLLAQAQIADVAMAPAADMFELGVKVQVLKRGVLFAQRASKLYEIYSAYEGLNEVPAATVQMLERDLFRHSLEDIWQECLRYWTARDAQQVDRANADPKQKMALVFRWYLGNSNAWAISGDPTRSLDYQIWCGPAMGAFNDWVVDSFLAEPAHRSVTQIGLNLLEGAAVVMRAQQARSFGCAVPAQCFDYRPRRLS